MYTRLRQSDRLLGEVRIDESRQRCDRFFLIRAVRNDRDLGTLHDAEGQDAQKALGIDAALFLLDPDAALELVGFLDEKRRRSGMKAYLIVNDYFFAYHSRHPLILDPYRKLCYYFIKFSPERQQLSTDS